MVHLLCEPMETLGHEKLFTTTDNKSIIIIITTTIIINTLFTLFFFYLRDLSRLSQCTFLNIVWSSHCGLHNIDNGLSILTSP